MTGIRGREEKGGIKNLKLDLDETQNWHFNFFITSN